MNEPNFSPSQNIIPKKKLTRFPSSFSPKKFPICPIQESPSFENQPNPNLENQPKEINALNYNEDLILSSIKSSLSLSINSTSKRDKFRLAIAITIIILLAALYCLILFSRGSYEKDIESLETNLKTSIMNLKLPYSMEHLRNQIQIKLLDSGINYFVIYDPSAKESASCFSIKSGSFHEQFIENISFGVAHLLEHSIFLHILPKERNLLSTWNAWTGNESTQYMFSTSNKNFLRSFEIYWGLLSNFTKTHKIYNETSAIDSEFKMDLESQSWQQELLLSYLCENKQHPLSRFTVGSNKTLKHKGIENEVYNFYENFYSTQATTVVSIINSDNEDDNIQNSENFDSEKSDLKDSSSPLYVRDKNKATKRTKIKPHPKLIN